jgi:ABC-type glutathione transport system ATPase component
LLLPLLEFDKVSMRYDMRRRGGVVLTANSSETSNSSAESAGTGIQALSEFSLSISPGESIGIIGESGAGKTTLAAIATGMVKPTSGRVLVDGEDLLTASSSRRRNARIVQLVWQDAGGSVDPRMRVSGIIEEPMRVHNLKEDETHKQVTGLLREVGLPGKTAQRYPHELSGGELQRVVIARALALNPRLLICDEPAASLDIHAKLKIADLLTRLQSERNLALMVIAHDLSLVRRLTRELIVINQGAIVERGPTDMLLEKPAHPYTQALISCDPSAAPGLLA